ncbi:hypothetical protein LLO_2138 [Legionella longbeachae NSW150]|uniref:Uncharacterized protein n=1 Tax=Legionella longbeachae serogroup 1 (strain NSW150) TaxID=661367 RepID=D3HJD8_LEGLN|nr:hypothetical protein LLO_2138 [Legionella longbeachae NSW150]
MFDYLVEHADFIAFFGQHGYASFCLSHLQLEFSVSETKSRGINLSETLRILHKASRLFIFITWLKLHCDIYYACDWLTFLQKLLYTSTLNSLNPALEQTFKLDG